jgi:hypothetical protein
MFIGDPSVNYRFHVVLLFGNIRPLPDFLWQVCYLTRWVWQSALQAPDRYHQT